MAVSQRSIKYYFYGEHVPLNILHLLMNGSAITSKLSNFASTLQQWILFWKEVSVALIILFCQQIGGIYFIMFIVCVCIHATVHMGRSEDNLPSSWFKAGPLVLCCICQAGRPVSFWGPVLQTARITCMHTPSFLRALGTPTPSSPPTCAASALSTEPSPQLHKVVLKPKFQLKGSELTY